MAAVAALDRAVVQCNRVDVDDLEPLGLNQGVEGGSIVSAPAAQAAFQDLGRSAAAKKIVGVTRNPRPPRFKFVFLPGIHPLQLLHAFQARENRGQRGLLCPRRSRKKHKGNQREQDEYPDRIFGCGWHWTSEGSGIGYPGNHAVEAISFATNSAKGAISPWNDALSRARM